MTSDLPATRHDYAALIDELLEAATRTGKAVEPWLAEWCKRDLFFLLRYGLKRKDCDTDWVFNRCREVQAHPNDHIDLWAREHYKSTIITYALSIQDILNDPEVTIGIFSHTRPIAKAFLKQIKRELETNEDLKDWFPDVLWRDPQNESPKWSEDEGLIVRRKSNPKEATVEAWGVVDGQPTGKHFNILVYDDLVTKESVTTPEMIEKTTDSLALSYNLGAHGGARRFIGTRYHFNDSYREVMKRNTAAPRIYAATVDGSVEGEPVFLTREQLAKKRADMGPYVFGCLGGSSMVLMADWTLKPIHAVAEGDMVVGWTMKTGERSKLVPTKVLATQHHRADTVQVFMESGKRIVCTPDHQWWSGRRVEDNGRRIYSPVGLGKNGLSALCRVLDLTDNRWPDGHEAENAAAYLAGIFDGEGTVSGGSVHISQCERTHPQVCARIRRSLTILKMGWNEHRPKGREHQVDFYLLGGRQAIFRFLMLCDPAKREQVTRSMFGARKFGKCSKDPIAAIEHGERQMVYNIETETGNYIADGYCSKNCQMLQNPTADATQGFKEQWLQFAAVSPKGHNIVLLFDPAGSKGKKSDYTAGWVLGFGPDRNIYVHDMVRDRLNLTERGALYVQWHRKWSGFLGRPVSAVGIEQYGMMADIEYLKELQNLENYRFEVTPLGGPMPKNERIRRLIPWFEKGRIFLPPKLSKTNYEGRSDDLVQVFINDEFRPFPVAPHDDMLDALARFLEPDLPITWPAAYAFNDDEEDDDRASQGRNSVTGY